MTAIQEYSSIAQLDSAGYQIGYHPNGGGLTYSSPITRMMEGLYSLNEDGTYHFYINQIAETKYLAVINEHPKFPFPYFFYALCLYDRDAEGWKDYAYEAEKILKYTTSIDGHHPDHDEVLDWTLLLLRDIDPRHTPVDK